MGQVERVRRAVGVEHRTADAAAWRERRDSGQRHPVVGRAHPAIVGRVGERERQDALLLEVRLVYARKALRNDCGAAEVPGRHGRMLAAAALAVVFAAYDDPPDAVPPVRARHLRARSLLAGAHVRGPADPCRVERADRAEQHVVAQVVQVAPVRQPRPRRRYVVRGALAGGLCQDGHPPVLVRPVPWGKRLEQLQAAARRVNVDGDRVGVGRRRGVRAARRLEPVARQVVRLAGRLEPELGPVGRLELVGERVEREPAAERKGHDHLGAGDKVHRRSAAVVAARKVAVKARHYGVLAAPFDLGAAPLPDARPACVGQDGRADGPQRFHLAVPLDRRAHLLRSRRDKQRRGGPCAARRRLAGDGRGPGHVLVRRVGAAAHEGRRDAVDVPRAARVLGHARHGPCQVRGVRPGYVGLELGQVDLDDAVKACAGIVVDAGVGGEQARARAGQVGYGAAARRPQVRLHARVVREHRARRADLGAHVGYRRLARAADRSRAGPKVLDDRVRPARHRKLGRDAQYDVLWGGPAAEPAGQADAYPPRAQHLPRHAGHHLGRIDAADADGHHAQAAGVGRMRVRADHQPAGKRIVLEHDLVYDARARPPKAASVL